MGLEEAIKKKHIPSENKSSELPTIDCINFAGIPITVKYNDDGPMLGMIGNEVQTSEKFKKKCNKEV